MQIGSSGFSRRLVGRLAGYQSDSWRLVSQRWVPATWAAGRSRSDEANKQGQYWASKTAWDLETSGLRSHNFGWIIGAVVVG